MSDKNVGTGLGKVYYAVFNEEQQNYGQIKEINDLISFSVQPSESNSSLYAGDKKIIIDYTTTVSGSIGVPSVPDDVFMEIFGLGEKFGQTMNYSGKAKRPEIALIIVEHNYVKNLIHILWNVKMTLPQSQGSTKNDSISYNTKELSFEALIGDDGIYYSILPEGDERLNLDGNLDKLAIAGSGNSADAGELYIGRISSTEAGSTNLQYSAITADMVKNATNVEKKKVAKITDYIADCEDNDYMIIAIPKDSARVGKKDNGFGGHVIFSTSEAGANGDVELEIDGVMYKLYGEICLAAGRFKLQVE